MSNENPIDALDAAVIALADLFYAIAADMDAAEAPKLLLAA